MRFLIVTLLALFVGCAVQPQPAAAQTDAEKVQIIWNYLDKKFTDFPPVVEPPQPPDEPPGPPAPPPTPNQRTIFSTTFESAANLGGWERCGNAEFHSGGWCKVSDVGQAAAYSGNNVLETYHPAGNDRAMRLHVLYDYGQTCEHKNLPNETTTTFMVKIPQKYSFSWLMLYGWKQNQKAQGGQYNEPTVTLEFGGNVGLLRANIKGRTAGAAGNGPQNFYQRGPDPANPNKAHAQAFPINQWVKIDYYVKHSTGNDGRLRVYQDGALIIAYDGRTMRENAPGLEAQLTNYGSGNTGVTVYFDNYSLATPQ